MSTTETRTRATELRPPWGRTQINIVVLDLIEDNCKFKYYVMSTQDHISANAETILRIVTDESIETKGE